MEALRRKALKPGWHREPWCAEGAFAAISAPSYRTTEGLTVVLKAPVAEVQKVLVKHLKPKRQMLTAVKFAGGQMSEITEPELDAVAVPALPANAQAAVTVAKPVIGCPQPAFPEADVRAARVLEVFLSEEQKSDFRMHRAFVAVGADTGHRYLITDRERPKPQHTSFRSLFDLEENRPLCVHDWEVPPPEEMLTLLLCVSLPGRESYVRRLPETWH